ncbi:MAG: DNA mismatch repair endonuclease MutL [Methanomicrobiales archaeon]|nr:DNA mismatch repair endonuclease MutL [Methanomicrobiales archaeon]
MNTRPSPPTIRVLDESTVNQIAAGEVVERPASVVKELIENAIDADARRIRVEITSARGAITRIQVTDDGIGMSAADAALAFTPHATSKIRSIADLERCRTLGFRGEALASIAAVAEVTLVTKPRGSAAAGGTRVTVRGGSLEGIGETGAPEGTAVAVSDLFFNTPARRKFLKSLAVELAHIVSVVEGEALAHRGIGFRLLHNGKERLSTQGTGDLADAVLDLFGVEAARALIPIREETAHFRLEGSITQAAISWKTRDRMFVSINRRSVHHPSLLRAIREGYGGLLPGDRYPLVFLDLSMPPHLVDVNIHPTKREVRVSGEQEILPEIARIVGGALRDRTRIPEQEERALLPAAESPYPHRPDPPGGVREPTHAGLLAAERQLRRTEPPHAPREEVNRLPDLEVIGQLGATYIVARTPDDDLILVDQHAAHERILYDQLMEAREEGARSQELLVPAVLHLSPRETAILEEVLPALEGEGFRIEPFGRGAYAVRAVPVVLGRREDPSAVHAVVTDLLSEGVRRGPDSREAIGRVIACRGALKGGTVCTPAQCERLLRQLRHTRNPYTCPHGRPTIVSIPRARLDAMFRRT